MRKPFTAALAAISLVGVLTVASAADAQSRYYGRDRDRDSGAAIAAGIAGLAVGAALAGGGRTSFNYSYGYPSYGSYPPYRDRYTPARPYYGQGYGWRDPRYAPRPVYRGRICTYWRYDRWGRAYPEQRRC